ncbi:MAG: response regulator transcription factor [Actinomycetota bacterium]
MGTITRARGGIPTSREAAFADLERLEDAVRDLLAHRLPTAPHVAAELYRAADGRARTIRELAQALHPAQRLGHRALPTPLPVVSSVADLYSDALLSVEDHRLLLGAALCLDDRLETLEEFAGRPLVSSSLGMLSEHVVCDAGTFRFSGRRVHAWVVGKASAASVAAAHERWSDIYTARGEATRAAWHRARSSGQRRPEVVRSLLATARTLSEGGHPGRALPIVLEAAAHAGGPQRYEALLQAGSAAVAAGYMSDAVDILGGMYDTAGLFHRTHALASLIIAESHTRGIVPAADPGAHRPRDGDEAAWGAWGRAAGIAAALAAERASRSAMLGWLDASREADARAGAGGSIHAAAEAFCALFATESGRDVVRASGPLSGRMVDALRLAVAGDIDEGLRILATDDMYGATDSDPLASGFERSPLAQSYRAVVEVLLLFWRGDVARARSRAMQAAVDLPFALPFAGLGVVLARRLDLAVLGHIGPLARALSAATTRGARVDHLVDRAIAEHMRGNTEASAAYVRLWVDRGAPATWFAVPGLDESGFDVPLQAGPPEFARLKTLLDRARRGTGGSWAKDYEHLTSESRTLRSPFFRGRAEQTLGVLCARRGEYAAAHRHLRAAGTMYTDAGADAWAAAVADRIDALPQAAGRDDLDAGETMRDPMSVCRLMWQAILTDREVEIAMLVVGGASNREIAEELHLSVRTIEVHVGRVLSKLDVRSRVELTVLAHRTGMHG